MQQIALSEGTAARRRIPIICVLEADGSTPLPSQTFTAAQIRVSKNGANEADSAGSWVEIGGAGNGAGAYYYEATAGELDTRGFLRLRCNKGGVMFQGIFVTIQIGAEVAVAESILSLTDGVESGLTLKQALQGIFATCDGKRAGVGTATETFRNKADTLNRVTATIDGSGNRTAVTYSFS